MGCTYLLGRVLNQTSRVAFSPRAGSRTNVDEVPGVIVLFAKDVVFGVVQQGEEFVEEALLAFFGELPVEGVHAAPELGAEIVHVLLRGHPVLSRVVLVAFVLNCLLTKICLV